MEKNRFRNKETMKDKIVSSNIVLYLEGGTALSKSTSYHDPEVPSKSCSRIYKNRYLKYGRVLTHNKLNLSEHSTIKDYYKLYTKIKNCAEEIIVLVTGTDNLPFLASYLDLHNNSKKIIITYSQRSLSRPTTDIFYNLDTLYNNLKKLPKKEFYTIIYGTKGKKPGFYSSNIIKTHSYKTSCFSEFNSQNKQIVLKDSGTLVQKNKAKFPSSFLLVSTPFSINKSRKSSSSNFLLLPGLGNSDLYTCRRSYINTQGPSLLTYSKSKVLVKNNWIRNSIKDYCLDNCSEQR